MSWIALALSLGAVEDPAVDQMTLPQLRSEELRLIDAPSFTYPIVTMAYGAGLAAICSGVTGIFFTTIPGIGNPFLQYTALAVVVSGALMTIVGATILPAVAVKRSRYA